MKKLLLNWWPPYLRRQLDMSNKIVHALCDEWADTDTYVENICLEYNISDDQVYGDSYGDSYGVPSIKEKVELLLQKIKYDKI